MNDATLVGWGYPRREVHARMVRLSGQTAPRAKRTQSVRTVRSACQINGYGAVALGASTSMIAIPATATAAPIAARQLTRSCFSAITNGRIITGTVAAIVWATPVGTPYERLIKRSDTPRNGPAIAPQLSM